MFLLFGMVEACLDRIGIADQACLTAGQAYLPPTKLVKIADFKGGGQDGWGSWLDVFQ